MTHDRFFFHEDRANRQLLQHATSLKVSLHKYNKKTEIEFELKGSIGNALADDDDFGDLAGEVQQNEIDPHKFARDLINDFQQSGEGGEA